MLYEKNQILSRSLFRDPTSEYRGAPFWSWNCALDKEEVVRQAHIFKEMGFGGYHMHVRTGLATPYMGDEFLSCIRACVDDAKQNKMLAWLYDEDRWPSGFAGGLVTREKRYRQRYLYFTTRKRKDAPVSDADGRLLEGSRLLARYKVRCICGKLVAYRRLREDEKAYGTVWYAYLRLAKPTSWYNNNTYLDTLYKPAVDRFAEVTYDAYQKVAGDEFGKAVPAIFTDEPQVTPAKRRKSSLFYEACKKPWTDDFDATFREAYGESILDSLPELFWEKKEGVSLARYRFYDHLAERFARAFADNLGARCQKMGILFTGHMLDEPTLSSQTYGGGETMRHYRGFGLPGIDMLCSNYEFTTAKQAQSASRQYGREGVLSELYGVSRWDYDFRSYKRHGDWQAALGVSVRVPHLSMMSMRGEAKRDYPASIFYQSPWYKKYGLLETHFARINTAMTRGKARTDIGVIHPIESFWLKYGPLDKTGIAQAQMDKRFTDLTRWLVLNGLDFDFICEATLPDLCPEAGFPLKVGEMRYKTIVVPGCATLRKTTADRLKAFVKAGGTLIFAGETPSLLDAVPSEAAKELVALGSVLPYQEAPIVSALEPNRLYGVFGEDGKQVKNVACQLREDNGCLWLFVARADTARRIDGDEIVKQTLTVCVKGEYQTAELWDTLSGEVVGVPANVSGEFTSADAVMYNQDSLLFRFGDSASESVVPARSDIASAPLAAYEDDVPYTLSEPNVVLLDRARFALGKRPYSLHNEEILRIDNICRFFAGLPLKSGAICQPWAAVKSEAKHTLRLKYTVKSEIDYGKPYLALEDPEHTKIVWNGEKVESTPQGYYVDKAIKTIALPPMKKGRNTLELSLPFGATTDVERCYLLGEFGVRVNGARITVTALPKTLRFGDLGKQGLPFYGGKIVYHTSFEGDGKNVRVRVPFFRAALLEAACCGSVKEIAFAPYEAELPSLKGKTPLDLTAYLSRQNAFGVVHIANAKQRTAWTSPRTYRHVGFFNRRYILCPTGILTGPLKDSGRR